VIRALMVLVCACTSPQSNEMPQAKAFAAEPGAVCYREAGKYSDTTFCLSGRVLLICGAHFGCLRVPLDEAP
jgi:hypothetical protein